MYDIYFSESIALFYNDGDNKYDRVNLIPYYQLDEKSQIKFMDKINDIISIEKCNSKALKFHFLKNELANPETYIKYLIQTSYWQ